MCLLISGKQRLLAVWCTMLVVLLTACGGPASDALTESSSAVVKDNTVTLLQAVYFDQRTPEGFYPVQPQNSAAQEGFYSVSHIKSTDILPLANRNGQAVYELSATDFATALALSESAEQYLPVYQQLVDVNETVLYYEFTRVDMSQPDILHYQRVFKSDMIDRSGTDRLQEESLSWSGLLATMPLSAVSAANLQMIVEYLWAFSTSNNYGNAVFAPSITENADTVTYQVQQARLSQRFNGSCDEVTVIEIQYTLNKVTGEIIRSVAPGYQLMSRRDGSQVALCQ